ncbi:MAG TPA: hypothetical protein VFM70_07290 [Salinimicrobium sp.]|nr:hypothetical protein [Salinimicrobium sp.]
MKKKLITELKELANEILEENESSWIDLQNRSRKIYEKLTVLNFVEKNLEESQPLENKLKSEKKLERVVPTEMFATESMRSMKYAPEQLSEREEDESLVEPNTEKIKNIVSQMPDDDTVAPNLEENTAEKSFEQGFQIDVDYDNLPQFEPKKAYDTEERPQSLNHKLRKGINIGLNDRIAFIKHLFDGSATDYNRVLSQLNTFKTQEEVYYFIAQVVKPDYNNWEGKEIYEARFLDIIDNKFN